MSNFWVQFILILAPLLLVPLALHDLSEFRAGAGQKTMGVLAASCLLAAHLLPPEMPQALLAVPWLFFSLYLLTIVYRKWQLEEQVDPLFWILRFGAAIYLVIGAMWALADRSGLQPIGFDPLIVLLTAVHFHYAGFALLWAASRVLKECTKKWERYWLSSVVLGVPLTAIGITASHWQWSPVWEMAAAVSMATAGVMVGWVYLRLGFSRKARIQSRALWAIAGLSLISGMILAALYGLRYLWPLPWLSIPWMYTVHGTLNSLGFAFPALLGWYFHQRHQSLSLP